MSGSNSIRDTFFEECEDLLEALVEGLELIDGGDHEAETVNAVFRAVHSMKGGAGAFGLEELVSFAHRFETVLDGIRSGSLSIDEDVMRVLHRSGDQIAVLVEACRDEVEIDTQASDNLMAELDALLGAQSPMPSPAPEPEFVFEALTIDLPGIDTEPTEFDIRFKPLAALFRNGHDPAFLLAALQDIGTLDTQISLEDVPDIDSLIPDESFLSWTIRIQTDAGEDGIKEVFEFVEGLCELDITPVEHEADPLPEPVADGAVPDIPMMETEAPAPAPLEDAAPQIAAKSPPETPVSAAAKPASEKKSAEASGPKATLRVDLDRVDRLINTVGELIINQSMIAQRINHLELPTGADIETDLEDYKRLARDIQDAVMAIRAQPVKPLFQRMSRIVREAVDATGKRAELVFEGENTEVDKTLIERLADPLTHMIRNAVDHGIEGLDKRREAGKSDTGRIVLSAVHQSGTVLIKVRDDGAGLNRARIREIAVNKSLIPADAELTDSEVDNLLFLPGFSTASTVSNLSGRGVGMDVVKNAITGLGGRVTIASEPGKGTTFTIVLPLTLAVMDGMVVSVSGETIVVPISTVVETIRPKPEDLHRIGPNEQLLSIRGSYVPVINVAERLGFAAPDVAMERPVVLLVDTQTKGFCAFSVEAIYDQRQVVVKGLDESYGDIPGVSAATILGDGKIALILDPSKLVASIPLPPPADLAAMNGKEGTHADAR